MSPNKRDALASVTGKGRPTGGHRAALVGVLAIVRIAEVQYRQAPAERGGIPRGIMCQLAGRRSGEVLAQRTSGEPTFAALLQGAPQVGDPLLDIPQPGRSLSL